MIIAEAGFAMNYVLDANGIDEDDIDYPLSLTYTLPASYNKDYKENGGLFEAPPKYVTRDSVIEINITSDDNILTATIDINSSDIPGRKAKVVGINNKAKNKSTYTLNGVEIVLPGE